jgi:hypothetical protein
LHFSPYWSFLGSWQISSSALARDTLLAFLLVAAFWLFGVRLIWAVRSSDERVWLALGLVALAGLALIPPIFHEHEPNASRLIDNNDLLGFLLPQLLPCLALVLAALLLFIGLRQVHFSGQPESKPDGEPSRQGRNPGRIAVTALALSLLVLVGGLYHLYWLFVWDSTYDSLHVFFLMVPFLTALFSAAVLADLLLGKMKLVALLFAILIPALMIGVFWSAKRVDFRALTEARAERVSQALASYQARQGRYPETLDQLAPRTMLSIPDPVILYGQEWCYQGATDSYQLGFVDREHWSSPELFATVYKTQGAPADSGDLCESEISVMKERYPDFYGFDHR